MSRQTAPDSGSDSDSDWEHIYLLAGQDQNSNATMEDRIRRVTSDEIDLGNIWTVRFSANSHKAFSDYYDGELDSLRTVPFESYGQEARVDYLLLKNYLERARRRAELDRRRDQAAEQLLPFAPPLVSLIEARQARDFDVLDARHVAEVFHDATASVQVTRSRVESGEVRVTKEAANRATSSIESLVSLLAELYHFFKGYDPLFDWWVAKPYQSLTAALGSLGPSIGTKLAGVRPDDDDEIVGEPIGRDGLLVELEADMIPYTPEELLAMADERYAWCDKEMKKAASQLGFGDDWKAALRHVQNIFVEPGQQPELVRSLIDSAAAYTKKNDLVTVPPLAEQNWQMFMMTPERQKVNPFFLGGPSIIVSYPTADMSHEDKLMSMHGNGPHLSKATAFHEMIPGHHLQGFVAARSRTYRALFDTPFYVEGWAVYWELVFWDRGDFFTAPEDRVGTLFWRMHRCARILFSIRFHLGQLSPQQCVDLLVDSVGHERATAEGEVRRSLNGDYGPLYQAGYYLGALQLYALRREVLGAGLLGEKSFHDRILQANTMPIEMLRALILHEDLSRDYKSKWKFYST